MGFTPKEGAVDENPELSPLEKLLSGVEQIHPERVLEIDGDYIKFAAAAAGETRDVVITHISDKGFEPLEFNCRTDFWGRGKAIGGYLEGVNNGRYAKDLIPYTREDFLVEDRQHPEPIANVLHTVKQMLKGVLKAMGTHKYNLYVGVGKSQRIAQSTMMQYKGTRKDSIKPLHLQAVHEYMVESLRGIEIQGDDSPKGEYPNKVPMEVDDWVIIQAFGKKDHIVVGIDKDARAQPVLTYNPDKHEEGILDCTGFGKLWVDSKKKVRGYGMKFLMFQVAFGDNIDCYRSNSLSFKANGKGLTSFGELTAFKALDGASNHKELFTAVVGVFKKLYPKETQQKTWQGEEFTLDWKYAFQELFNMARMLRWEGDEVNVLEVLDKLGVDYE